MTSITFTLEIPQSNWPKFSENFFEMFIYIS